MVTFSADTLPESLAVFKPIVALLALLYCVTLFKVRSSFAWNEVPLWLLNTNVYTCSLVIDILPSVVGKTSNIFLSYTLKRGPIASDLLPVTFSPTVNVILPEE